SSKASSRASPARCARRWSAIPARAPRFLPRRASSVAEIVALVDYGAGNLHSVRNALAAAGAEDVAVTADPAVLRAADRIVLPGVGAFGACASGLNAIPGLVEAMEERVMVGAAPFLGI